MHCPASVVCQPEDKPTDISKQRTQEDSKDLQRFQEEERKNNDVKEDGNPILCKLK